MAASKLLCLLPLDSAALRALGVRKVSLCFSGGFLSMSQIQLRTRGGQEDGGGYVARLLARRIRYFEVRLGGGGGGGQ